MKSAILIVNELIKVVCDSANEKDRDADKLDQWADESRKGGWSTHQVDPMRAKADQLRREASHLRRIVRDVKD